MLTALLGLLDVPFLQLLSPLLLLLTLCAAFFPLYYVFPDADSSSTRRGGDRFRGAT